MFKFKSLITTKGNYCYNDRFIPYKNSEVITEDKEEAEYLRNNSAFIEIKEEMEVVDVLNEEPENELELEKLRAKAVMMGLKPHHMHKKETLLEMIKKAKETIAEVFKKNEAVLEKLADEANPEEVE